MTRSAKHCLLVVDDEPDLVQSVKDLLRFDYKVLCATRASEGLRIMQNENVHVVMSDQRMPEMSGVQFLSQLKLQHPSAIRLLFTAYADLQAVTDAINQGNVYRYISKPWDPEELKTVLRQAVDFYELQEERRLLTEEIKEKNRQLETANRELSRANELKRAFIRVASHELRTPLTIILGLSELGQSQAGLPSPVDDWMKQIHRSSIRLNERVDQVVKMLLAEQFERPLRRQMVDPAALVQAAVAEVSHFARQRKLQFEFTMAPDLKEVSVEREKMHDVLVQLLINAVKFTPDGGVIYVTVRQTPGDVTEIVVADTGMGIEKDCLPRVFEPFFTRYDVSRHSSGDYEFDRRGLGLGLAVVKTFIEMHGGQVSVHSEIGKGTTFTILLP